MVHRTNIFTEAHFAQFQKYYPNICINEGGLCVDNLSKTEKDNFALDLMMLQKNQGIPLENLCCRLDNFESKNPSQEELVRYSQKLLDIDDRGIAAGLYMYGDPGVGKTHLSLALAKEFMRRGYDSEYRNASMGGCTDNLNLIPGQVWIIDDLNSGYGMGRDLFKRVVIHAHNAGGRVFVTSNKPYNTLLDELFNVSEQAERMRLEDRSKGMFKILAVGGSSNRVRNTWYLDDPQLGSQ